MTRVCLWGTSLRKVADEAQFLALLQLVDRVAPAAEVTILARPHPLSTIVGNGDVHVIPTANLPAAAKAIARSDLFIMIGGCFMESPRQAAVCATLMVIARLSRTPVISVGVTAFPYRQAWARQIYSRVFNAMEAITVREQSVLNALSDLSFRTSVVQVADPRYVLTPPPDDVVNGLMEGLGLSPSQPLICVTLRHLHDNMPDWVKVSHEYSKEAVDRASCSLASTLDVLASVAQLVVLPMHASINEDIAAATAIKVNMSNPGALRVNLPQLRCPELIALIKRCDLILASRLAAGMFSASTATPVFAIAYEKRLADLMSDLGLEDFVVPWLSVDHGRLETVAKRAWAERHRMRVVMQNSSQSLVQSAWANAEVIARHVA